MYFELLTGLPVSSLKVPISFLLFASVASQLAR